jgi:hypothetical protein
MNRIPVSIATFLGHLESLAFGNIHNLFTGWPPVFATGWKCAPGISRLHKKGCRLQRLSLQTARKLCQEVLPTDEPINSVMPFFVLARSRNPAFDSAGPSISSARKHFAFWPMSGASPEEPLWQRPETPIVAGGLQESCAFETGLIRLPSISGQRRDFGTSGRP